MQTKKGLQISAFLLILDGYMKGVTALKKTLYVVVPCYNEAEILHASAKRLKTLVARLVRADKISAESRIIFVDDGSRDRTWGIILELSRLDKLFGGIKLSRNRGHQNALLAGLMVVRRYADAVITIDADLQDDPDTAEEMLDKFYSGCDIVYGVRSGRKKDTFLKRFTAETFYKILKKLGCDVVFNHADYRLLSARALSALSEYGEQAIYLRGIIPMLGFKTACVTYERVKRTAGESKYPLKRMLALALDGLTGFTLTPLRLITGTGAVMLFFSVLYLIYTLIAPALNHFVPPWRMTAVSVWLVGGIITLSLGIVGEYTGRALMETKRRPRYVIEQTAGIEPDGDVVCDPL